MFGALVRASGLFAILMLLGSVLKTILNEILPILKDELGSNAMLYQMLVEVRDQYVFIALLTAVVIVLSRSVVESQVGGVAR